MCRVIITNRTDFLSYDKQYGIPKLFAHLEKQCGGHGNGYALIRGGHIIETRKGQHLSNEEIYKNIVNKRWDYLVWHTRINSMGGESDANCHPFVQDEDCLAMNGTEYTLRTASQAFSRTDTEIIFKNLVGMGVHSVATSLIEFSSVFVGCAGGIPFAVQAGGSLSRWNKGGKSFHASTFPDDVKHTETLPSGYIWENGKENRQFVRTASTYTNGYYYGSGINYGSSWHDDWGDYITPAKTKAAATKTALATPAKDTTPAKTKDAPGKKSKEKIKMATISVATLQERLNNEYTRGYEEGYEQGGDDMLEAIRNGSVQDDIESTAYSEGYANGYQDASEGLDPDIDTTQFACNIVPISKAKKKADPASDYNVGFSDGREAGFDEGYEAAKGDYERKALAIIEE